MIIPEASSAALLILRADDSFFRDALRLLLFFDTLLCATSDAIFVVMASDIFTGVFYGPIFVFLYLLYN
jgi:hypothetical protein